jgi:hypothetical protein
MRPLCTAATIESIAVRLLAGMRIMSLPARKARTALSPAPNCCTMAPIAIASVTASPPNPRESRSTPVMIAGERVAGVASPTRHGSATCAVITAATPSAMAARNGTSSRESRRSQQARITGTWMWESVSVSPWPGKCLAVV